MKMIKVALAITALTGFMSVNPAAAAERSAAIFPTDVLNRLSGAVTAAYTFSSQDIDYTMTQLGTTETLKREMTSNNLQWKAQLGLGYGLQVGLFQDIELAGRDKMSANGGSEVANFSGGSNPAFEIAWNPMQVFSPKNPLQALVSYTVKGKGLESKQIGDDFTQHSAKVFMSYNLAALKLRPYVGYEHTRNGERYNQDLGHINVIKAGVEYAAAKHLKLNLDYTSYINAGFSFADPYTVNEFGVNAEYKVPMTTVLDLYLVPSFSAAIMDDLKFKSDDPNVSSSRAGSSVGYSGGFAVKAVF